MNIQTTGFDYSTLDAETRDFLLVKEANIRQYGNKATDAIVGMGREFNDAKAHTEHGEFTAWVAKRFPHLSMDSVQNYMRMAALVDQKPQFTVFGVSVLGLLAKKSTPEKARIEAEAYLKKPDKATVEAITGLIDSCKPAPRSRHQKTDPAPENETIVNEDTVDPIPPEESIQPGEKPASVKGAFQSPATTPPVGLIKRHNVPQPAELMGNLHPVTVTPDEKSNVMAGAFATNGNGAPPVDSTKLQAEIIRLKAENTTQAETIQQLQADKAALEKQIAKPVDVTKYGLPNVLTVQYQTRYGEERLDKTLRYLLDMGLKHTQVDLAGHMLELVKTGKLPAKAGKGKKQEKPVTPPNPNAPFITELIATYLQFSGVIDRDMYAKPVIRGKFEQLHLKGITPDLLQTYICGMRMDRFWGDKAISVDKVMGEIIPWLDKHKPGWKTTEEIKPDVDPRSPDVPPEDPELMRQAEILNEQSRKDRLARSAMLNPFAKVATP